MRILIKLISKLISIPLFLLFGLLGLAANLLIGLGTYVSGFLVTIFVVLIIASVFMTYWPGVIVFGIVIAALFFVLCAGMIVLNILGNVRDFFGRVIIGCR